MAERSYPGAPRFPQLTTIAMVESRIERGDKIESDRRSYISSRALSRRRPSRGRRAVTGRFQKDAIPYWAEAMREDLARVRASPAGTATRSMGT